MEDGFAHYTTCTNPHYGGCLHLEFGWCLARSFDQIFVLYSPLVYETADIIDTYVYRIGIKKSDYSFSTAAGMFQSFVGLVLILVFNKISKKTVGRGLW